MKAQHDNGMAGAGGGHRLQCFGADKGRIAVQHKGITGKAIQRRQRLCHGMGGAQLFGLQRDHGIRVKGCGTAANKVCAMARHHDDAVGHQRLTGAQGVVQQGGGTEAVKNLGQVRIHAAALTCGQNDQRDCHLAPFFCFAHLLPRKQGTARGGLLTQGYRMQMNQQKTVVFDLDGTLADTSADLLAAANACFRGLGHGDVLGPGDTLVAFHGGRAMLRAGFDRLGLPLREAEVTRLYPVLLAAYAEGIDTHTQLYPGVVTALEGLRGAGYALAICTNKPAGLAETLVGRLGIRGLFGSLVGADTLPVRKPEVAPYRLAVEQAGGVMGSSMLVGDTETDRKTGLAAGVPVALVTFGPEGRGVARLTPEALLDHYDDLAGVVTRLIG